MNDKLVLPAALFDILDYKTPTTLKELADKLDIPVDSVRTVLTELQKSGYGIVETGSGFLKTKAVDPKTSNTDDSNLGPDFRFGIVSDCHLASKTECLEEFEKMYDVFVREGITTVYNAGDVSDGYFVYRGQEFEVKYPGQEEQIDYVVAKYPRRKGITTKFISGNHDLRMYEKGGVDPGYAIANQREDMVYLGPMSARVTLYGGVKMDLLHPIGGPAYALSYKMQRAINNLTVENVPDILVWGHFHTTSYMCYRSIHALHAGSFKAQGRWEKSLGLNPTIGGWLIEGSIRNGRITRFKTELFTFQTKE